MTKAKKTRKCGAVKRMLNPNDTRLSASLTHTQHTPAPPTVPHSSPLTYPMRALLCLSASKSKAVVTAKSTKPTPTHSTTTSTTAVRHVDKPSASLFFRYNASLGPPYQILIDTNFINFALQNKLDLFKGLMDCLLAKATPLVTDCVLGELEKLGTKYRVALRLAKDERMGRLSCSHPGTYADDCLVRRVTQHKCYIVATCDRDLKRRIRKVPGVPIMYITRHQFSIERFADVNAAPRE